MQNQGRDGRRTREESLNSDKAEEKNSLAAANRLFKLSVITDAITMMGLIRGIKPFIHKCCVKIGQREEAGEGGERGGLNINVGGVGD